MRFRLLAMTGVCAALAILTSATAWKLGAAAPAPSAEPGGEGAPDAGLPARIEASISFESGVRPILEAHCMPCHFEGGKLYATMPFDRSRTIRRLGEKLFTRIQKEDERAVIRAFLAQPAGPSEDAEDAAPPPGSVRPTPGMH